MEDEAQNQYHRGRAALVAGRIDEAIRHFHASATLAPHFKTYELLGECLMKQQRFREAIQPLAAATALNRGVRAPSLLAESFMAIEDQSKAEEFADIALQRNPTNRKAKEIKKRLSANQAL